MESTGARRRRRARPARRRLFLPASLAVAAVLGATAAGTVYVKAQAHPRAGAVSSSSGSGGGEVAVAAAAVPEEDHDALLASAMESVTVPGEAAVSVAVLAVDSGAAAVYGGSSFDTASIVKVNILAALLLQAQDADRRLTAAEKAYAAAMIENSDNDSASALWRTIGKAAGLDAANERFGLTDTAGGEGMLWGLTQTTAADQLTLLQQVFGDASELSEASRTYLQALMGRIAVGQRWGVSAAAEGSSWALKNGWLPRSTTGLWDVDSIGRVTVGGHDYLVSVLSNGNATQAAGVSLVETVARTAVSVVAGGDASASASGTSASASASASAVSDR
ncbi:serine hydrolase [Streptomyces sp. ME08-AFT2]|uniref:serine hydrolase n=1 Tax=Streptomyces sp. ME08-AFT2 TaxID=3028683 RepID=UPI0029B66A3C|nr:serine hydrolase [Streptomyces sp. ME08-AFT2]MDX3309385.1 serine hydrolase [Streptomyces sp. ME08-AFT2]